jgi:hypothetical protein
MSIMHIMHNAFMAVDSRQFSYISHTEGGPGKGACPWGSPFPVDRRAHESSLVVPKTVNKRPVKDFFLRCFDNRTSTP